MNSIFWIAILGVTVALTIKIYSDLDLNKVVYSHAPGKCRFIDGIDTVGSEDLIILPNGLALISSGPFIAISSIKSNPGKLYLYDPSKETSKAEPLTIKSDKSDWKDSDFFPAGVTVWDEKGELTIFVICTFTRRIHAFQLKIHEKLLIHTNSFSHPQITNPNNIVAISKDQFYVSNFVHYSGAITQAVEFIMRFPFGTVWFYDGSNFVQVLGGLKGPNGLAVSKSKKHLYLATHFEEALRVYRIEPTPVHTNLTLVSTIPLHTGVDNLNVDTHGSVLIGCHPIAYKSGLHLIDSATNTAPSQILKVTFIGDHSKWRVEELYADDGDHLPGSTVAALTHDGHKLLIGTIMHKTMICQMGH